MDRLCTMRKTSRAVGFVSIALLTCLSASSLGLEITTSAIPPGMELVPYSLLLEATNGVSPYTFEVMPRVHAWGDNFEGQSTVPPNLDNAVALDGGYLHSLALRDDGTVVGWGDIPTPVDLTNVVVAMSCGSIHNLAVLVDGTVTAWGADNHGQSSVPPGLTNVVDVSGGIYHSLALTADGQVVAWGRNVAGESTVPSSLSNVVAIAAGEAYNLALLSNGTVTAWGSNSHGQSTVPAGLSNVVAISTCARHSLALKSDGTVASWGQAVAGDDTVLPGLTNVTAVAAGVYHTLVLHSDGTVQTWGSGVHGQMNVSSSLRHVVAIAAGNYHSLALQTDDFSPLPDGLLLSAEGLIDGTPTIAGTQLVNFAVSDALGAATNKPLSVVIAPNPDTRPVIVSTSPTAGVYPIGEGVSTTVVVQAYDPEGSNLTHRWTWDGIDVGSDTNSFALSVDWTDIGTNELMCYVADMLWSNLVFAQWQVVVEDLPVAITTDTLPMGTEMVAYGHQLFAAHGVPPYAWTALTSSVPSGLTLSNEGVLSGLPLLAGPYDVEFSVQDALGASANRTVSLEVTPNANTRPVIIIQQPPSAVTNIDEGASRMFRVLAHDPEGVDLTYRWTWDGTDLNIESNRYILSVDSQDVGAHELTCSLSDDLWVDLPFALWDVNVVDLPIEIVTDTLPMGTEMVAYSVPLLATNSTAPLAWTIASGVLPQGLTLTVDGMIAGTPTLAGAYDAEFSVQDALGGTTNKALHFDIGANANLRPVISSNSPPVGPVILSDDQSRTFTVWAHDPEGSNLTCRWTWDGAVVGGNTHTYSRTYALNDVGTHQLVCTVSDDLWIDVVSSAWEVDVVDLPLAIVPPLPSGMEMVPYSHMLEATNGFPPYAFAVKPQVSIWGRDVSHYNVVPPGMDDLVAISCGATHTVGIRLNGTVTVWGSQSYVPPGLARAIEVAAGWSGHTLALDADGQVFGWGSNNYGQTTVPPGLGTVLSVAAGGYHSLALRANGTVAAWGRNYFGQCNVPAGLSNVVYLEGGEDHTLAVRADGTVVAWGYNNQGQCNVPSGLSNVVAVAGGNYHSLALNNDGTVVGWGSNIRGEISIPAGLTNAVAIAAGFGHSMALTDDGTVLAWGSNDFGERDVPDDFPDVVDIDAASFRSLALRGISTQLPKELSLTSGGLLSGVATNATTNVITFTVSDTADEQSDAELELVIVPNPNEWPVITSNLPPAGAISVDEGSSQLLTVHAHDPEGQDLAYRWFRNGVEVGGNTNEYPFHAAWGDFTTHLVRCYVSDDVWPGRVHSRWDVTIQDLPIEITTPSLPAGMEMVPYDFTLSVTNGVYPYLWTISGGGLPPGIHLSLEGHLSGMVTNAGSQIVVITAQTFPGEITNVTFQFDVDPNPNTRPVVTSKSPSVPPGFLALDEGESGLFSLQAHDPQGTNLSYRWTWDGMEVGTDTNAYLHTVAWGDLGSHVLRCYVSDDLWDEVVYAEWPVVSQDKPLLITTDALPVGMEMVWYDVQLAATNGVIPYQWGTAWPPVIWGYNTHGQSTLPTNLSRVIACAGGLSHSLVVRPDGTVAAWGYALTGATTVPAGLSNVTAVAAGFNHSLALQSDGTVAAWGVNGDGQSTVPPGLTDMVGLAAGVVHSLAVRSNGQVVAWGGNHFGNTWMGQSVVPPGLDDAIAVAAGGYHSLALRQNGTVVAWGANINGQTSVPSGLNAVIAIEAGEAHSMALRSNGTVVVWGDNSGGQRDIPASLTNVVAIAAGYQHNLALMDDGVVVGWGYDAYGQATVPTNALPADRIAAGGYHSFILQGGPAVLPQGLNLSTDGLLSGYPAAAGTQTVHFTVQDAHGTRADRELPVRIDPNPNRPPLIVSNAPPTGAFVLGEGSTQLFSVQTTDPEGSNVTYRWSWDGVDLGTASNVHQLIVDWQDLGDHELRCDVSDGLWSNVVYAQWDVTVTDQPLEITTASLPDGTELVPYEVLLQATNGAPPFTWSIESGALPAGYQLSAIGVVSGVATNVSTNTVTFAVQDDVGASTNRALQVVVGPNPNTRPVITANTPPAGLFTMGEGTNQLFQVSAYDPEGSNLVYRWTWNGVNTGGNSSTFLHTTDWDDAGTYQLACFLSDDLWTDSVATVWLIVVLDDNDGDGVSNEIELDLGRDPNDPSDGGGTSSLAGTITSSGFPIRWARITLVGAGGSSYHTEYTGSDGAFFIGQVVPGHYFINVSASEFADEWYDDATYRDGAAAYSVPADSIITNFNMDLAAGQSPSRIEVTSEPPGLPIMLNLQRTTNVTPAVLMVGEHDVFAGRSTPFVRHKVGVESPVPWPQLPPRSVTTMEAETVSVHFDTLSTEAGSLSITTTPAGVEVFINVADTPVGQSPVTVTNLAPGVHWILLREPLSLRPPPIRTTLYHGATTDVSVALHSITSATPLVAQVKSIPPNAGIFVDYLPTTHRTDSTVGGMDPGLFTGGASWQSEAHSIMLRQPGYLPARPRQLWISRKSYSNHMYNLVLDAEQAVDGDGDGLPDPWEDAYRLAELAPTENGANDDPDGDGATNEEEMRAGTHPLDAGSTLAVAGMQPPSGAASCTVTFPSIPGRLYLVLATVDFPSGWETISSVITASQSQTTWTGTVPGGDRLVGLTIIALSP